MKRSDETAAKAELMVDLGAWLGRHQAFALIANRCSAADAECLKTIRDSGAYKELGVNWEEFCVKYAGISRSYADQLIQCFEEYGENYRRMAEIMSMSPPMYRLIASAVSEKGLELHGEYIPIESANRDRIVAAVKQLRAEKRAARKQVLSAETLEKVLDRLVAGVLKIAIQPENRAVAMVFVERAGSRFESLARDLRHATVIVE